MWYIQENGKSWGETDGAMKMHLINWKRVCTPKQWGGLGLRTMRDMNQVSMMKEGWNLISNKDYMWVEVIKSNYICGRSPIPRINTDMPGSNFWRGICHSWKGVESKLIWRIGPGAMINFWKDRWIPSGIILRVQTYRREWVQH